MAESLIERLGEEIWVMSGAMGTVMQQKGADLGGCISQWIVEHPRVYRDLVGEYFAVGCDIVAGATFNLNRISLAKFGLEKEVSELNRGVMGIVSEVRPEGRSLAGNMGPTGKMLQPLGDLDPGDVLEAYSEQARALAEGGAEILNLITFFDLEEAVIALRAAKAETSLPVMASLAYNPGAQGYRTMMGVSPEAAARRLEDEGADVIGLNCGGVSLSQATEVIALLKANCRKPLIVKPNAGPPHVVEGKAAYGAGPEQFAAHAEEWMREGARILSACCGSGPAHVEAMVKKVRSAGGKGPGSRNPGETGPGSLS